MKRPGNSLRYLLYKILPLDLYLKTLSKLYFISFDLGLLRKRKLIEYPYFMDNLVKEGDVVIDIGANLGYLTRTFSKLVGSSGTVYAVEPVEPILKVLSKNIQGSSNVTILPFALGTENKKIRLGNNTSDKNGFMASGANFVLEGERKQAPVEFEAEMKRGSELFKDLTKIDFIKVDVEGFETEIMPEMEALILKHRPMILLESRREKRKAMIEFFEERDFECWVLHDGKFFPTDEKEYWDMLLVHHSKKKIIAQFIA